MNIHFITCGKLKSGDHFYELVADYSKRLPPCVTFSEIVSKHKDEVAQRDDERKQIIEKIDEKSYLIVLDETGKDLSSRKFAQIIDQAKLSHHGNIQFIIGGANGVGRVIRDKANLLVSLSSMTWPHKLVRVMAVEQLYRALSILEGHPYHKD